LIFFLNRDHDPMARDHCSALCRIAQKTGS
jgi:hypothetical protein